MLEQSLVVVPVVSTKSAPLAALIANQLPEVAPSALVNLSKPNRPNMPPSCARSEERRVGKECRSRWSS